MAISLKEERQQLILETLQNNRQVTVAELSRRFDVSEVTIRRDLREMAEQGMLRRAHGGAARRPARGRPRVITPRAMICRGKDNIPLVGFAFPSSGR